jgi:hypothetical protein
MLGFQSSRVYQVHEMTFFNDFLSVLHKYGQILDVSLENVKRLEKDVHKLDKDNKALEDLLNFKPVA